MTDELFPREESLEEGLERLRRQAGAAGADGSRLDEPRLDVARLDVARPDAVPQPGRAADVRGTGALPAGATPLPSFSRQVAWQRIGGGALMLGFALWMSGGIPRSDLFVALVVLVPTAVVVSGVLRLRAAARERAWYDATGIRVVEKGRERAVAWPALRDALVVGSSKQRRVVLVLVDGGRVAPRMWDGVGASRAAALAEQIQAARAGHRPVASDPA